MLQVLIPAAGKSQRFLDEGYTLPKGLITMKWNGSVPKTMIEHVIPADLIPKRRVFVGCSPETVQDFESLLPLSYDILVVPASMGQAHTVAHLCRRMRHSPVLIINCDNAFRRGLINEFLDSMARSGAKHGAVVFHSESPSYGYVNNSPLFTFGAEKKPISNYALAGAFYLQNPDVYLDGWEKYMQIPPAERKDCYITSVFEHMMAGRTFVINKYDLHEWGTPATLKADPTVELISWER